MKLIINEIQEKIINELSPRSTGVEEFIDMVEKTDGLLRHLGFTTVNSMKEYIRDGDNDDLDELKNEASEFLEKKDKN